jgi:hypothetical protein
MATRATFIMFQQPIDPECKVDVRIAEQFLEKIDGLIMNGLRRDLAAAEARVLAGDAGAVGDAEFLFVSIRRRLHDRDAIRREVIAWIIRVRNSARAPAALSTGLVRYDAMCRPIDAAYEVEEVKDIHDKARALELYERLAQNVDAETRA